MSLLVPFAGLGDTGRIDGRPDAIVTRARQLVPLLAAALSPGFTAATVTRALGASSVAAIVARALDVDDAAAKTIDLALVLLADHELNNSSFTARVVASTDADTYACVAAALASLSGPRHGTASERFARFADEVGDPDSARAAVRALRKKGEVPPGFGHPLYPAGDPRTPPLLAAVRGTSNKRARTMLAIVEAARGAAEPSVDVGLAALIASLGAQPPAASGLFAVARAAGRIAHVIEQRAAGVLLRPRARYVGA
jgi:citrate synthase